VVFTCQSRGVKRKSVTPRPAATTATRTQTGAVRSLVGAQGLWRL
jgi:NaMN:DMB phosphoribosyltransferase